MKTVPLHGKKAAGRVALVDDEDYDLVMQYRWYVSERKRDNRMQGPYVIANTMRDGRRTMVKMHKLITGWPMVDHRDHDGLNNQRSNLRSATDETNQRNKRGRLNSSSRYKGVTWNKANRKWMAQIGTRGRNRYLGQFQREEEAARAYDAAALEAFGEFACLNFPDQAA